MGMKPEVAAWLEAHGPDRIVFEDYRAGSVFRLRENVYGVLAKAPHRGGDSWAHVVVGDKKALLIDTGFGIGDLRQAAGRLSGGKPLTVVNTHFHADHTLGNSAFEAVYISFLDAPLLRAFQYEERWNEFVGKAVDRSFFDDTDRIPFRPYEIREIANHQIFDLGGCEIEAILMPGHSPGGMCFLDRRDRVLFSGDALMDPFPTSFRAALRPETPGREYATVAAFRRELANLVTRADEFDCLCDGHGVPNSDTRRVSDMLECAESVVQAPDSGFDLRETARGAVKSKRYGIAAIDYRDDRVS